MVVQNNCKQPIGLVVENSAHVKVFLRLRPMDKLETSKRSKDCIELHENPRLITVESPILGAFDFNFDQVGKRPYDNTRALPLSVSHPHLFPI